MNPALGCVVLEKGDKVLSKLKVSGGGRCNLTNGGFAPDEMALQYPRGKHFMRKALHRFSARDTVRWFEDRGVRVKQEPDGRVFPASDSSQTIIDCLMKECGARGVQWVVNREVKGLEPEGGKWSVVCEGEAIQSDFVCVACGGYNKGAMYDWLKRLGHTIIDPVPSLFTFNLPRETITSLMGVSLQDAAVRVVGTRLVSRGALLITHWGLSGPAILRLSAWGAREMAATGYDFRITVDWAPGVGKEGVRDLLQRSQVESPTRKMRNGNPLALPQRLWEYQLRRSGLDPEMRWCDLPGGGRKRLIENLSSQELSVCGKSRFKEEFVTAGGISLSEVDVGTMMSKKAPDLFFAGEILDVDGLTGGFNLQHAWTSGFIAGTSIAQRA